MRKELPKVYDPRQVEPRIYQMWMDGGCFKAEPNPDKKPFSIVMPPPNVTGQLHMGHAMDATLQDILIRFKRMQGYEALPEKEPPDSDRWCWAEVDRQAEMMIPTAFRKIQEYLAEPEQLRLV